MNLIYVIVYLTLQENPTHYYEIGLLNCKSRNNIIVFCYTHVDSSPLILLTAVVFVFEIGMLSRRFKSISEFCHCSSLLSV